MFDYCIVVLVVYSDFTGKPPPRSRNQCLPGLLVYWFAGLQVYGFAGLLVYWFTGLLAY